MPDVEADAPGEAIHVAVLEDHKLLVGRGFQEEGDAFLLQDGDHVLRAVDGVFRDAAVEVVREEGVELDAQETALREEGAVLLDGSPTISAPVTLRPRAAAALDTSS